jgi:hypothetical protein
MSAEDARRNLAADVPQVSRRARAYKLSDDGASEQALRRRYAKDRKAARGGASVLEYHRAAIDRITARQAGPKPVSEEMAAHWIRRHEKAIRDHLAGRDADRPVVRVVPPIVRRVQREDRKRNRG